jgi:hypothetical protein
MMKRTLISIAAALLVAAAAGVAYATIPDDQGVIHACYKTDGGQLRASSSASCNPSETALSWNQAGPQGPQGPEGPQGPPGPAGSGSDVYSETASGSGGQPVPVGLPGGIAQLPLPAGKYTVIASLTVDNDAFDSNAVRCQLFAVGGGDDDEAFAFLAALTDPGDTLKIDLNIVHEFAAAGHVEVDCGAHAEASWIDLHITAVRAASITTVPFTPASG